ncbi:MAG: ABC transporter ATP-binding protein/permease [Firmicutes bacterium]|nr:ABC transporter ATP-binding protein/permease [[Eubacterium] siraeum]MCM1487866.1 ABC transporter ATP-binding protein/permease [Bacillota bacterium]
MKKIAAMIGKHWYAVAASFIMLYIMAMTQLAIPACTSDIINIGIQQSGIEYAAPEKIRQGELQKLLLMTEKAESERVLSFYELSDEVYSLKEGISDKEKAEIADILSIPMVISFAGENMSADSNLAADMSGMLTAEGAPDIKAVKEQLSQLSDSIISQVAINYVKAEYDALGTDTLSMQMNYMLKRGGVMLAYALASVISSIVVTFIASRTAATLGRDIRERLFRKVMTFSNAEFDKFSTASIITRCTNDVQQIQMVVSMTLTMVALAPIMGIGALVRVLDQGASMTWIIGIAVAALLCLIIVLFIFAMPKFKIIQKMIDNLNRISREILTGLPVIRAFSREEHEKKRFDKANTDITRLNLFINRLMTIMNPTMMFIMNGISVLIVWVGSHQVDEGLIQTGDLTALITYTMQIIMSFLMISMISVMMPRAMISFKRVGEILDTDSLITDPDAPQKFEGDQRGTVEFKNVSFKYDKADEYALQDISFVSKPGETTAIIGSTGSGKSTLANLIPRFFDVTEGEILVDGKNVKNVTLHDLRDKIGYVSQKAVLLSGTVRSNIAYSDSGMSEEQIEKAAGISQSAEFISQKTDGYDAPISQGGGNVSGGQKQRLSIARAVAKNPEIYIFDDSFSALDFKTDAALRSALKENTAESTVILIAQRISTVLNADQILVLDEGRLAGKGTHKELMESCGIYRQIALSQLSEEELIGKEGA